MAGGDLGEEESNRGCWDIRGDGLLLFKMVGVVFVDGGRLCIGVNGRSFRVVMAGLGVDGEGGWSRHRGGRRRRKMAEKARAAQSILLESIVLYNNKRDNYVTQLGTKENRSHVSG